MGEVQSKGRLEAVQVARAVAAMLVVAVHAIDLVKFRQLRHGDPIGFLSSPAFYSDFGASGVDFFFVISGFVMAMVLMRPGDRTVSSFLDDRFARIMPLYWLMSVLCLIEAFWLGRHITPANIAMSISLWPILDPREAAQPVLVVGWTLAFEFAFYVTLLPWLRVARERRLLGAALSTGLIALTGYVVAPHLDLVALLFNPIWFEFMIGIALFALWQRGLPRTAGLIAGWLGLAALAIGFAVHIVPNVKPVAIFEQGAGAQRALVWGLPYGLLLAGLLSLRGGAEASGAMWRGLCRIGDASYSLYLVHLMLFVIVEYRLAPGIIPPDVVSLLSFPAAIALGLLAHRYVEKPLLAAIKRSSARRNSARRQHLQIG